ncbi:hypothetical protein HK107_04360 [Parvularcula sp. ZS-1/3]|uniref:Uncharacterized protein n=1 Tax=Parvularcula mediterranea TaxID=2732508 RepID=A0A7Y3RKA0_9PROT|nr:hypothetical protein [Parvularcula mediterranea]NNU15550.1 hypothetical protein [Parvularcula mediterranea]
MIASVLGMAAALVAAWQDGPGATEPEPLPDPEPAVEEPQENPDDESGDDPEEPGPEGSDPEGEEPDDEGEEGASEPGEEEGEDAEILAAADMQIVEETLPTVDEVAFPELVGDFDGDGAPDEARARESDTGVQIALELSSTGEVFVEHLGADALAQVEWEVIPADAIGEVCVDPIACPITEEGEAERDVILVTIDGSDRFILRWDGGALETFFVD